MVKPLLEFKVWIKRLLKVKEDIDPLASRKRSRIITKYLIALTSIVLITLFYPYADLFGPLDVPREGDIASENIIANVPFSIPKDLSRLSEERQSAILNTPLYFRRDLAAEEQIHSGLKKLFATADSLHTTRRTRSDSNINGHLTQLYPFLSEPWLTRLTQTNSRKRLGVVLDSILANDVYYFGVIGDSTVLSSPIKLIVLRQKPRDIMVSRSQLLSLPAAYDALLVGLNGFDQHTDIDVELMYEIGRHFILPNVIYDTLATQAARDSAVSTILPVSRTITAGDLLTLRGKRIDAETARLLQAYAGEIEKQATAKGWFHTFIPILSRFVLVATIILLLYLFLFHFRPDVYWSNNKLLALLLILALELLIVNLIGVRLIQSVYLFPIAILSLLVTILFDSRLGVVMTLLVALLLGILYRFNFTITLITAVTGTIACFSAGEIRRRSEFYRIIIFLSLTYVVMAFVIESLKLSPTGEILTYCGYGLANGFISPILTIGILPMFESVFGFSSNITLLELADLNQPLLKRLAMEAPGTYHHSIILGTLAEAAAKTIGANSLLARVGAYYHDIGKMEIPEYFVENQMGIKSRHESLNPTMSALVLSSHVKKGRRLGEEAGLPDAVLNFIEEHHGTTVMTYFLNKAKEMGLPLETDEEFRYPGPKPQSRETAILMLADATEAASRTLDNPTPARIRNLIQKLINDKFTSGELAQCGLTLKDLNDIREAFVSILIGVFHQRIVYPQKEEETD